jgi:hypothetical protein
MRDASIIVGAESSSTSQLDSQIDEGRAPVNRVRFHRHCHRRCHRAPCRRATHPPHYHIVILSAAAPSHGLPSAVVETSGHHHESSCLQPWSPPPPPPLDPLCHFILRLGWYHMHHEDSSGEDAGGGRHTAGMGAPGRKTRGAAPHGGTAGALKMKRVALTDPSSRIDSFA